MRNVYLLPCPCGQKVSIEPRQAGETIQCGCGRSLMAPALLAMSRLEMAPPSNSPPQALAVWGFAERTILAGVLVMILAIVAASLLAWRWPVPPTHGLSPELVGRQIERLTPAESIQFFYAQAERGLDPTTRPEERRYAEQRTRFVAWSIVSAVALFLGLGVIAFGLMNQRRRRRAVA